MTVVALIMTLLCGLMGGLLIAQTRNNKKLPYNKTEKPEPEPSRPAPRPYRELPSLPKGPDTRGSLEASLWAKRAAVISEFSRAKDPGYKCARCGKLADRINRRDGLDIPYCDECDINRVA